MSLEELERLSQSTKPKTKITALRPTNPPSSETQKIPEGAIALYKTNKTALEQVESSIGGRAGVIDTLGVATLDKKQQHFLDLLSDPRREKHSIDMIARDSGLTPLQVLDLFRSSAFAKSHTIAMARMAEALPAVVDDIATKSVDAKIECPTCQGSKDIGDGITCPQCYGKGEVMRVSDLDRQKILLEATGVTKRGNGVNVNVQTNVGIVSPSSFFSRYVKDSDRAAYDVSDIDVIDVKPEEPK